ncbi:MAG: cation transporter, partial [Actinomycetota bacterium]
MKKRQLPVFQPDQNPDGTPGQAPGPGCTDDCCAPSGGNGLGVVKTPARPADGGEDGYGDAAERTVVRVEGMDCASCAATVEKRVGQLPGVYRATVNFAAGRLDAEHEVSVTV